MVETNTRQEIQVWSSDIYSSFNERLNSLQRVKPNFLKKSLLYLLAFTFIFPFSIFLLVYFNIFTIYFNIIYLLYFGILLYFIIWNVLNKLLLLLSSSSYHFHRTSSTMSSLNPYIIMSLYYLLILWFISLYSCIFIVFLSTLYCNLA